MKKTPISLGQLAELVGGRIYGDAKLLIHGAAVLGEVVAGEITLVDHVDRLKKLSSTQAAAVVLAEKVEGEFLSVGDRADSKSAIVVTDVHDAFGKIICHFRP